MDLYHVTPQTLKDSILKEGVNRRFFGTGALENEVKKKIAEPRIYMTSDFEALVLGDSDFCWIELSVFKLHYTGELFEDNEYPEPLSSKMFFANTDIPPKDVEFVKDIIVMGGMGKPLRLINI